MRTVILRRSGPLGVPLAQHRRRPRLRRAACQGDSGFLTVRVSLGRRLWFYPRAVTAIRAWHASCRSHLAGVGQKTSDSRERRALGRAGDRGGALGTDAGVALLAAHRGLTQLPRFQGQGADISAGYDGVE